MNAEMRDHLAGGGRIGMSIVTDAVIEIDGRAETLALAEAPARRLLRTRRCAGYGRGDRSGSSTGQELVKRGDEAR